MLSESNNETVVEDSKDENTKPEAKVKDKGLWRDLVSYWFLGLSNNFGFIVMLTAAHDIIFELAPDDPNDVPFVRDCNHLSTGTILLADVMPAMIMKIITPFIIGFIHLKMIAAIVMGMSGFAIVAFANTEWLAIMGVALTSTSYGMGEACLVGYASKFDRSVVSTWSSGTGGAAILGSLSYSVMKQLGLSNQTILLLMTCVPVWQGIMFWGLLRHPVEKVIDKDASSVNNSLAAKNLKDCSMTKDLEGNQKVDNFTTVMDKIKFLPKLLKYMIPLFVIYFSQYFINQGLLELVYFPGIWLNKADQYRWFQVTYQVSVFISRSSINLIKFKAIWILAILQFINMIYLSMESIFYFSPNIYIVFAFIFFEGFIGGGAYAKTFYRISEEIPEEKRQFAMAITTFSDTPGITLAGLLAMPAHNAICNLPIPSRLL